MAEIPPPVDVAELVARYAAGETMRELAAERGVSRFIVRRWLVDAGVTIRSRGWAPPPPRAPRPRRQVEGLSTGEVATVRGGQGRLKWDGMKKPKRTRVAAVGSDGLTLEQWLRQRQDARIAARQARVRGSVPAERALVTLRGEAFGRKRPSDDRPASSGRARPGPASTEDVDVARG